jgi:Cu-Zn family superoxide dismutase
MLAATLAVAGACKPKDETAPATGSDTGTTATAPAGAASTVESTTPAGGAASDTKAEAKATLSSPDSKVGGTVTFTQDGYNVKVVADVTGLSPGKHGIHVHEYGKCDAPAFESAGAHVNPDGAAHGCPGSAEFHPGDLGNIEVGADGKGHLEMTTSALTVTPGSNSVVGKAVLLHERVDDCVSRPAGNSGGRIACGVVEQSSGPQ